jgi:hypothetical protein
MVVSCVLKRAVVVLELIPQKLELETRGVVTATESFDKAKFLIASQIRLVWSVQPRTLEKLFGCGCPIVLAPF